MKPKFHYFLFLSFLLAFSIPKANAQTLITFWDFNQTRPTSGNAGDSLGTVYSYANSLAADTDNSLVAATWPLYANYTTVTSDTGFILYVRPQTRYSSAARDSTLENGSPGSFWYDYSSSNYTYFTSSDSGFAGGNMFIRARNPSDSCNMYLYIPTTGYQNISLQFAESASSTKGANYVLFSYSTDLGSTWNNLTQAMDTFNIGGVRTPDTLIGNDTIAANSDWKPVQIDFSTDASVNNNDGFVLKMMFAGPNTVLSSGNTRFDNFAVWATGPSGINELSAQSAGYNLYPNPTTDNVTINSERYSGMKTITIYDVVGQTVSVIQSDNRQTIINTSSLVSGVYFAEIKEMTTGNKYTLKIVKN